MVSTYNHTVETTTDSSTKTTYTGSGPWTITINDYTDTACATSPTTSDVTLETSCTYTFKLLYALFILIYYAYAIGELGGFGMFPSDYGYGTVGSSVVTSPPSADGNFYIEQLIDFLLHRFHFRSYDFELCHFLMRDCPRIDVDFCDCFHRKY